MAKRKILITGAAGFVAAHVIEHFLKNTEDEIIGCDSLTYAGTWDRLKDVSLNGIAAFDHPRFTPLQFDFRLPAEPNLIKELQGVTHILHMGAESHVDNSVKEPMKFVQANVIGTVNMLELARQLPNLELFTQFSTDEVCGSAPMDPSFTGYKERERYHPSNPYAGSKAAAEMMVLSYANTYGIRSIITNGMNIFGERQHPEKFIPKVIKASIEGGTVHIHSAPDKKQAGMRTYIHGRNVADALLHLYNNKPYEVSKSNEAESYNIVGEKEVDNLTLANTLNELIIELGPLYGLKPLGATFEMIDFHSARPFHDVRYKLDGSKMKSIGWEPPVTFEDSLRKMVKWLLENPRWLNL